MNMKKILFHIPAIIFTIFYGFIVVNHIGAISPVVLLWLVLFFVSGFILGKNIFWGSIVGMLPAINLIYLGTRDTGQMINEIPIGVIVLIFYIICGGFVFYKNKKAIN